MNDPYAITGGMVCTICGLTYYQQSYGGPGICPSCDCGNFGLTVVTNQKKQLDALSASKAALEAELQEAKRLCDEYFNGAAKLMAERDSLRAENERLKAALENIDHIGPDKGEPK